MTMELNNKIYLCYSEEDNRSVEKGLKGWVSNFYKFLTTFLSQISDVEKEVILLPDEEIARADFDTAAAVIVICTENLAHSGDCVSKLKEFGARAKASGNLFVGEVPRIFKVHKRPFNEPMECLADFEGFISYDFYMIDPLTGEAHEFTRFFGGDAERSYWMKLVDMAYDLDHVLKGASVPDARQEAPDVPRDNTVYLASTGVDMVIRRDIIKRELIRHGYKVLPQRTLPKDVALLEQQVKEDLANCRLSIHLVGEDYGYKPEGSDFSVVDIQNRIAAAHTQEMLEHNETAMEKRPFSRLIWVSPDLNNVSERQKIFIENLKSDAGATEEAEVLQTPLSDLKAIIREELVTGGRFKKRMENEARSRHDGQDGKVIYLIQDKRDTGEIATIKNCLEEKGYLVVTPSYEGDLKNIRDAHHENLRICDASIIYFGGTGESWIKTKLQDLLKAPGFGRKKSMRAKAVYFEDDKEVDLDHYKKNNALVLGMNGQFKPEHLNPFLNKLEN